jgi:hypothetical protein
MNNVERKLISILLLAAGVSVEEISAWFGQGIIKKDSSGPIPTTVFTCGAIQRIRGHNSVIAEMHFESAGRSIEWLLHKYPNNHCEIEVLVNANLEAWGDFEFPLKFEIFVSPQ